MCYESSDVHQELTELKQLVVVLITENTRLAARVAELEALLDRNGKNSHQPSSADNPYDKTCTGTRFSETRNQKQRRSAGIRGQYVKDV